MNLNEFKFYKENLELVLPIIITIVSFTSFWFISQSKMIKKLFFYRFPAKTACEKHFLFTRYTGFLLLGLLPVSLCLHYLPNYTLADYGLRYYSQTNIFSLISIIILSVILIPLVSKTAKKPKNLVNYPLIRRNIWTRKTIFINLIGWFIYLLAYEVLFRGILLIPLSHSIGVWPAIAINITIYAATHIPKGLTETIGAFLIGTILCVLTLMSQTIWIALIVHLVIAYTNSFTSLKYHPNIHFFKRPKWYQTSI